MNGTKFTRSVFEPDPEMKPIPEKAQKASGEYEEAIDEKGSVVAIVDGIVYYNTMPHRSRWQA